MNPGMNHEPSSPEVAAEPAGGPDIPAPSPYGTRGLEDYLVEHRNRWTDDALESAAIAAGWDEAVVREVLAKVQAAERSMPLRARARTVVSVLYLGGYLVLVGGMVISSSARMYGGAANGALVLTFFMGPAYLLARLWLGRKGVSASPSTADFAVLLSVPAVLWLIVGGVCVASGLPIPRA